MPAENDAISNQAGRGMKMISFTPADLDRFLPEDNAVSRALRFALPQK
jgi:hypothetical protein